MYCKYGRVGRIHIGIHQFHIQLKYFIILIKIQSNIFSHSNCMQTDIGHLN